MSRIAIFGSSGFIGRALSSALRERGDVTISVRRDRGIEPHWNADQGLVPAGALSGFDAVINLAGENVGARRWSDEQKQRILQSRIDATRTAVTGIEHADPRPPLLINSSALGYYGDRGDERLADNAPPGSGGFLTDVTLAWEAEARKAEALGVRVVLVRTGTVLGREDGALPKMLTPFRLGLGGRIGAGSQYMSWIHIDDVVGALLHLLDAAESSGPYNVTAPEPVPNTDFTRALGRTLHRPTLIPVPRFALELAFGEMGSTLLLQGQRAVPERLLSSGYRFRFPELEDALADLVG